MGNRSDVRETIMSCITDNNVAGVSDIVRIVEACIAEIDGRFFLIVLLRIGTGDEEALVIRISSSQADTLENAGVERCRIQNTIPASTGGRTVTIICAFVVGDNAYLVVFVENSNNELRLVRIPLCRVLGRRH